MTGENVLREVVGLDNRVWDRQLFGGGSEESADCSSRDPEANQAQLQKSGGREGREAVHWKCRAGATGGARWSRVCGCSGQLGGVVVTGTSSSQEPGFV